MSYRIRKARELRQMSTEELRERLKDIGATQMSLRAHKVSTGAMNPGQWRNIKKEKARILTILGERSRFENGKQKGGFRRRDVQTVKKHKRRRKEARGKPGL